MRTLIRTAGRLCISVIFVYTGYGMINNAERYAKRAADAVPMLPDDPMVARAHGATMMVAGSTLALGILPRMSARILALTMIPNTLIGHPFWKSETPEDRRTQLVQFMKNTGLFGGLLYLSADKRTAPQAED
jgi:putative oxidoreductase